MATIARSFILTSACLLTSAVAADLPKWATQGLTMDGTYHFVVCSADGLDPEDVKQVAESKCLASAAKLGGVTVKVNEKSVQSLTGADASEVAEILPLTKDVNCEWTDRYLERVGQGFRVWLRCRVKKSAIFPADQKSIDGRPIGKSPGAPNATLKKFKRAIMTVTTVPTVDRILVIGDGGERVIEVTSNVVRVELNEGDTRLVAKKQKYHDALFDLPRWKHGDSISKTIYMEQEL
jgi:hypothetical protein